MSHLVVSGRAPIPSVHNPEWIKAHGHLYRFSYLFFALMGERFKYYFAWKVHCLCVCVCVSLQGVCGVCVDGGWSVLEREREREREMY